MFGHDSDVELALAGICMTVKPVDGDAVVVINGACDDRVLALRPGLTVTVVVTETIVVKKLTEREVVPEAVTVTNVAKSEFVLLKVANEINVELVENVVKLVGTGIGVLVAFASVLLVVMFP